MNQLDKWNKELENISNRRYKQMDDELYNFYKDALRDIKKEVKGYIDTYDELSFSKRLQVERQLEVGTKISDVIAEMGGKETRLLRNFITDEGTTGYYGTFYALEGAENVQLNFSMLPKDYIRELVNEPVAGRRFSTRLYGNRDKLAKETTSALLQGAVDGKGYGDIAKRIGELTEANYKRALRIARTEGGRVQSTVKQKAYEDAEAMGIKLEKQWMSTLDEKTRTSHQALDGQRVEINEQFEFEGYKADGPKLFGVPRLDINCRCTTIPVVHDIEPEFRVDNTTGEHIKYTNYNEWAEAKGVG